MRRAGARRSAAGPAMPPPTTGRRGSSSCRPRARAAAAATAALALLLMLLVTAATAAAPPPAAGKVHAKSSGSGGTAAPQKPPPKAPAAKPKPPPPPPPAAKQPPQQQKPQPSAIAKDVAAAVKALSAAAKDAKAAPPADAAAAVASLSQAFAGVLKSYSGAVGKGDGGGGKKSAPAPASASAPPKPAPAAPKAAAPAKATAAEAPQKPPLRAYCDLLTRTPCCWPTDPAVPSPPLPPWGPPPPFAPIAKIGADAEADYFDGSPPRAPPASAASPPPPPPRGPSAPALPPLLLPAPPAAPPGCQRCYGAPGSDAAASARLPAMSPLWGCRGEGYYGLKAVYDNGAAFAAALASAATQDPTATGPVVSLNGGLPDPSSPGGQRLAWDWGRAGFGGGGAGPSLAVSPPYPKATADVQKDYGAVGDGQADDSGAFLRAIAAAGRPGERGVLRVPAGTYRITRRLVIPSRLIVRGAGRGKTTLLFPSLADAAQAEARAAAAAAKKGQKAGAKAGDSGDADSSPSSSAAYDFAAGSSPYSYGSPSWISFEGPPPSAAAATIQGAELAAPAPRGARVLALRSTAALRPGDRVVLEQRANGTSSSSYADFVSRVLLRGQPLPADVALPPATSPSTQPPPGVRLSAAVVRVLNGTHAELDRALPYDALPQFGARLLSASLAQPHTFCALEHLSVSFPWTPYPGPGNERGFNAVAFVRAQHSWVRDVLFANADAALHLRDVEQFSVLDAAFTTGRAGRHATPASLGLSAGRSVSVRGASSDVLLKGLDFRLRSLADVSLSAHSSGVALSNSRGQDLSVVPEGGPAGPLAVLVTATEFGDATRPWGGSVAGRSGGPARLAAAAGWTVWNAWAGPPSEAPEAAALDGAKGTSLPPPPPSAFGPGVVLFSARMRPPGNNSDGRSAPTKAQPLQLGPEWLVTSADEPFGVRAWPPDLSAAMRQARPAAAASAGGRWDPLAELSADDKKGTAPFPSSSSSSSSFVGNGNNNSNAAVAPLPALVAPGVDGAWGPVVLGPPPPPPPTPQQLAAREARDLVLGAFPAWRRAAAEARDLADALAGERARGPPPVPIQPLLPTSLALSAAASGKPPAAMAPWASTRLRAPAALREVAAELEKGVYACDRAKRDQPAERQKCCLAPPPPNSDGAPSPSSSSSSSGLSSSRGLRAVSEPDCPACRGTDFSVPSALYGCGGELWDPAGRLADWSWAGARLGRGPPSRRDLPPTEDLKRDYGAVGDGVTDDTEAFLRALQTVDRPKEAAATSNKTTAATTTKPAPAPPKAAAAAKKPAAAAREAGLRPSPSDEELSDAPENPADQLFGSLNTTRGEPVRVTYASWSVDPSLTLLLDSEGPAAAAVVAASRQPQQQQAGASANAATTTTTPPNTPRGGVLFRGTIELLSAEARHARHGAAAGSGGEERGSAQPRPLSELALSGELGSPAAREDDFASAASGGATFAAALGPAELARQAGRALQQWAFGGETGGTGGLALAPLGATAVGGPVSLGRVVVTAASPFSGSSFFWPPPPASDASYDRIGDPAHSLPALIASAAQAVEEAAEELIRSGKGGSGSNGKGGTDGKVGPYFTLAPSRPPSPSVKSDSANSSSTAANATNATTVVPSPSPSPPPSPSPSPSPAGSANTTNATASSSPKTRVLYLPPGRYVLKKKVDVRSSDLILRGAGADKTTIFIPLSLTQAYGNTYREGGGCCASDYSHGTGFLNFWGWDSINPWNEIARVTRPAKRGDTRLYVNSTSSGGKKDSLEAALASKAPVRFAMDGDVLTLLRDLKGGYFEPTEGELKSNSAGKVVRLLTRVVAVGKDPLLGPFVELERPLQANASLAWKPRFHRHEPTARNVGVEDLTVEFAWAPFAGHLKEDGYNALHFNQVADGWVRNVRVLNADAGVYFWGAQSCAVENVEIAATRPRGNLTNPYIGNQNGHRGVWLEHGADNLVKNLSVANPYTHDVTVSWTEQGTVVASSSGADLNIDHHRTAPFGNLYTNLTHGRGNRPLESSGDARNGPHSASWPTYWNSRGELPFFYPPLVGGRSTPGWFAPLAAFVGFRAAASSEPPSGPGAMGWWAERTAPRTWPEDLFEHMRASRDERYTMVAGREARAGGAAEAAAKAEAKAAAADMKKKADDAAAAVMKLKMKKEEAEKLKKKQQAEDKDKKEMAAAAALAAAKTAAPPPPPSLKAPTAKKIATTRR